MKLQLSFIALSLALSPVAFAGNIAGIEVDAAYCENAEQVSTVTAAFQTANFPVAGSPGIAVGVINTTSQILEYCKYMNQLNSLMSAKSVEQKMASLNKITDNRWAEELELTKSVFDAASSTYTFSKNSNRKAAFNGAKVARNLKAFNRAFVSVYNKQTPAGSSEVADLAKSAQRRAVLAEMTRCPKPQNPDKDYQAEYEKDIVKLEREIDEFSDDAKFYQGRMMALGGAFLTGPQIPMYEKDVINLVNQMFPFKAEAKTESETTVRKTGGLDENKRAVMETGTILKTYQNVRVDTDSSVKKAFVTRYEPMWKHYVQQQYGKVSRIDSKLMFGNEKSAAELNLSNDMKRIMFDCPPSRINATVSQSFKKQKILMDPMADRDYEVTLNQCIAKTKVGESNAEDAFSKFLRNYLFTAEGMRLKQATYYTWQSKNLGMNFSFSMGGEDGMVKEEVACADQLSIADKLSASLEIQKNQSEFAEKHATYSYQSLQMQIAQQDAQTQYIKQLEQKDRAAQKSRDEETKAMASGAIPSGRITGGK